jgi:hypothetical protein
VAFTTGQTMAQMITELTGSGTLPNGQAVSTEQAVEALNTLAHANGNQPTIGGAPAAMLFGILVKCTTTYYSQPLNTAPVFAYDATPT